MRSPFASLLACLSFAALAGACSGSGKGGGASGSPTPTPTGSTPLVTYYEDVAPLLVQNCAGCHQPGSIAPFSLLTLADAMAEGQAMKIVTANRSMPPNTVDVSGACNTYKNQRYLDDAQIKLLGDWFDGGMQAGNPANAPPGPTPIPTLANVTATLDLGQTYTPPMASGPDLYRCFIVDPGLASTQYLTGFQVAPGMPSIVHHVVVYSLETAQAETDAAALDANDAGLGYTCFGGSGLSGNESKLLLAWAPGEGATTFTPGTGIPLAAGRKMIMQVHYNLTSPTGPDETTVKLTTAASVTKPAIMTFLADTTFSLQPGLTDTMSSIDYPISAGNAGLIYSVFPHMHKMGTTMKLEIVRNGTPICTSDVPRWNFNWQDFHEYTAPIPVLAGDTLRLTCHWNTTTATGVTTFGEGTGDEMCVFGLYATGP